MAYTTRTLVNVRRAAVVGNICALPLYWATAHFGLQRVTSLGTALVIAAAIATMVAGVVILAWFRSTFRGALAQLIALTPFVLFSTILRPPELSYAMTFRDFGDPRAALGLFLFAVVPALLVGAAIVWMRRGASRRESRAPANDSDVGGDAASSGMKSEQ